MLTEDQIGLIRERAISKGKIAGIKLYREFTGANLIDSKKYVQQLLEQEESGVSGDQSHRDFGLDDALMDSILNAIQDGDKLKAVKIYKDATGNRLKPSKEFIEKLMHELALANPQAVGKSGCLFLLIAIVVTVGLLF